MGRAISLVSTVMAGARVAGQLTYIPAHIKNGKKISARVLIPVYCNSHRGHDQKTGEEGRKDSFKLQAWGKLADICCRSLPPGKAIDVKCRPGSYSGKLFNQNGTLRTDATGVAIEVQKVAFTIEDIVFGEESSKMIAQEIAAGRRPVNWDKPNHPDYQLWVNILTQRQAMVWDGRSPEFMYARVIVPNEPGIQLDFSQAATPYGMQNIPGAPAMFGYPNNVPNTPNMPNMVADAFRGTPKFDPMTGQPLQTQAPAAPPTPRFDPMTGQPIGVPAASGYAPAAPAQAAPSGYTPAATAAGGQLMF